MTPHIKITLIKIHPHEDGYDLVFIDDDCLIEDMSGGESDTPREHYKGIVGLFEMKGWSCVSEEYELEIKDERKYWSDLNYSTNTNEKLPAYLKRMAKKFNIKKL